MIFIGLNTAIYYDEQLFALAHELYHYITKTGKAYETDMDEEDKRTEKMADRFAAELLLPSETLNHMVMAQFKTSCLKKVTNLRLLRFIARLQSEWWLPYRALVLRLNEEKYITDEQVDALFKIKHLWKNFLQYCSRLLHKVEYDYSENGCFKLGVGNIYYEL